MNFFIILKTFVLILKAFFKNWITLVIGLAILLLIFNFIKIIWLKWFLAVMFGGGLFYSIYDDMMLYIQNEALKAVEKLDRDTKEKLMKKYRENNK